MKIEILGTGCPKCRQLEEMTRQVVKELGLAAEIEKVKDIVKIMDYPILSTPALVINGKVVLSGGLPRKDEVQALIVNESDTEKSYY